MQKRISILAIAIVLVGIVLTVYFVYNRNSQKDYTKGEINRRMDRKFVTKEINGYASTNIVLGGELAEEKGKIYYSNANDDWSLYVEDVKGGNRKKLNDTRSDNINIANGYIYYRDVANHRIIKMSLDGNTKKILYEGVINNLIYFDGYIYFFEDYNDKQVVVKLKDNGIVQEKLFFDNIYNLILYNGWFYYYNFVEKSIKKVKIDGSSNCNICKAEIDFFALEKGFIFFTDKKREKIYQIDIDGNNILTIDNLSPDYLNIQDRTIYYCNINDSIWRTDIDKNRSELYVKDSVLRFYITENVLLYDYIDDNQDKIYQKLIKLE